MNKITVNHKFNYELYLFHMYIIFGCKKDIIKMYNKQFHN